MNNMMEHKACTKCRSLNQPDADHCQYCHERFNQAKIFVERAPKRKINRKLIIAGGSLLAAAGGFIFKRKAGHKKKKAG